MIALDTSVWIELWEQPWRYDEVASAIRSHDGDPDRVVVPATVIFESYRWMIRNGETEDQMDLLAGSMSEHEVVELDARLARTAAFMSITTGLAAADATILATARSRHAHLLTYDTDFAGIPDVTVLSR